MNKRREEEYENMLEEVKIPIRKNIRKIKSGKKQSACSSHTLPDTLTKSTQNRATLPPNTPSIFPIQVTQKPVIISSLKTLLARSSTPIIPPAFPELPLSSQIKLKDRKTRKLEGFKLFREDKLSLFSQRITQVNLNEPGYDNDDDTDNEQIKNGIKVMEDSIIEGLKKYKDKVANLGKFES